MIKVDFSQEASVAVEFVRVLLNWSVDMPLRFQRIFQFTRDVNTVLRFKYERLQGFCERCGMLTHDTAECPLDAPVNQGEDNQGGIDDDQLDGDQEVHVPDDVGMQEENLENPVEQAAQDGVPEDAIMQGGALNTQLGGPSLVLANTSFTQLMVNVWNAAPLEGGGGEYEKNVCMGSSTRKRKFMDELLESCHSLVSDSLAITSALVNGDTNEDNEDSMAVRWDSGRLDNQYGSFLRSGESTQVIRPIDKAVWKPLSVAQSDTLDALPSYNSWAFASRNVRKKNLAEEFEDKRVVILEHQTVAHNALAKINEDYGEEGEQSDLFPSLDRGAVGPVPPHFP
ncbi:hypothetical protein N665_0096s0015 [Sinapis alba]|nr:hypothetical protein N665_0096s0015 [Sinapis alba]